MSALPLFSGPEYDAQRDERRLLNQLQAILKVLKRGGRFTVAQLAREVGCSENSAGAQARNLRKPHLGGHDVRSERVGTEFVYWLHSCAPTTAPKVTESTQGYESDGRSTPDASCLRDFSAPPATPPGSAGAAPSKLDGALSLPARPGVDQREVSAVQQQHPQRGEASCSRPAPLSSPRVTVVYRMRAETNPSVRCSECGGFKPSSIPAGKHSPHYDSVGVLRNCAGVAL